MGGWRERARAGLLIAERALLSAVLTRESLDLTRVVYFRAPWGFADDG